MLVELCFGVFFSVGFRAMILGVAFYRFSCMDSWSSCYDSWFYFVFVHGFLVFLGSTMALGPRFLESHFYTHLRLWGSRLPGGTKRHVSQTVSLAMGNPNPDTSI